MFHLQSLNIHKQDPLILTPVMSYVFQMISVERGTEYIDLEKEAPWELEYRPPPYWPYIGAISFRNVDFRYSLDEPLVLKHLGAYIFSRKKVCFHHLPLSYPAKDLAPRLLLLSLSVCQGFPLLLMDAD